MQYIVAYDFGTTGVKTCLFSIDGGIRMEASAYAPYGLYILPDGGALYEAVCRCPGGGDAARGDSAGAVCIFL